MLDFVDETFHQMPFFVEVDIILPEFLAVGSRWNDHFGFVLLDDELDELISIIALVGNQPLKIKVNDPGPRLE